MPKFDLDSDFVRKLSDLLEETGLNEIEYAQGNRRIRVVKNNGYKEQTIALQAPPVANTQPMVESVKPAASENAFPSPMVGTAYLAPEPGAATFVSKGDTVKEGQVILIIEAMKVMNQIRAPKSGVLKTVLVENQEPVEYGQPLFVIE